MQWPNIALSTFSPVLGVTEKRIPECKWSDLELHVSSRSRLARGSRLLSSETHLDTGSSVEKELRRGGVVSKDLETAVPPHRCTFKRPTAVLSSASQVPFRVFFNILSANSLINETATLKASKHKRPFIHLAPRQHHCRLLGRTTSPTKSPFFPAPPLPPSHTIDALYAASARTIDIIPSIADDILNHSPRPPGIQLGARVVADPWQTVENLLHVRDPTHSYTQLDCSKPRK